MIYLVPEILSFLETIGKVFYKLGQGLYVVLAAFNKMSGMISNIWSWIQDPPVSNRITIILSILFLSIVLSFTVKCFMWAKKK